MPHISSIKNFISSKYLEKYQISLYEVSYANGLFIITLYNLQLLIYCYLLFWNKQQGYFLLGKQIK